MQITLSCETYHFLCISCQFKGLLSGFIIISFILSYRAILGSNTGSHWAFRNTLGYCLRRATCSHPLHIHTKLTPFSVVIPIVISLLLMLHHIVIIFLISLWLAYKPNSLSPDYLSPFSEPIISWSTQYHVNSLNNCWVHW